MLGSGIEFGMEFEKGLSYADKHICEIRRETALAPPTPRNHYEPFLSYSTLPGPFAGQICIMARDENYRNQSISEYYLGFNPSLEDHPYYNAVYLFF